MKLIAAFSITVLLAFGTTIHAQERSFADVYAECGIGAMLFNKDKAGGDNGRILAIISNATWDWGTTAHISNQSSAENCQGASASTAAFIFQNHDSIETDLAQGHGEHIVALLDNLNCQTDNQAIISAMRSELGSTVEGTEKDVAFHKSSTLYNSLVAACTA